MSCPVSLKRAWALELQQLLEDVDIPTDLRIGEGGRLEIVRHFETVGHRIAVFVVTKSALSSVTFAYVDTTAIEVHATERNALFPNIRRFVSPASAFEHILSYTHNPFYEPTWS
jgi:hypothetical protein